MELIRSEEEAQCIVCAKTITICKVHAVTGDNVSCGDCASAVLLNSIVKKLNRLNEAEVLAFVTMFVGLLDVEQRNKAEKALDYYIELTEYFA